MTNREIDVLVAEAMGMVIVDIPFVPRSVIAGPMTVFTDAAYAEWRKTYPNSGAIVRLPHFTTDIAAAMQVIAAMEARGLWCSIKSPWDPSADGQRIQWYAGFTIHDTTGWNGRADFYVFADTAPMAISLAALKAVGVEVTEARG